MPDRYLPFYILLVSNIKKKSEILFITFSLYYTPNPPCKSLFLIFIFYWSVIDTILCKL